MSRFNRLEFEENNQGRSESVPVQNDEKFYLKQAGTAFEAARFEESLRSFSKVIEHNPKNTVAWAGQVRSLIELGEFTEAKVWADKALETFPNEPELLAAKAVSLARIGDLKAALAFSDASIEERGDTPYIWLARGDVLLAREEKRADYCFEKAFLLAPRDWFVRWLAARVQFFYKKISIALKSAQEALNLDAGHASVWLLIGHCQKSLGMLALAENSFEQARQLDPLCVSAEIELLKFKNSGFWSKLRWGLQKRFS